MIITKAILFLCLFYGPWVLVVQSDKHFRNNLCLNAVARTAVLCFLGLGFVLQSKGGLGQVCVLGILFSTMAVYYSKPAIKKAPLEGALYDRNNNRIL